MLAKTRQRAEQEHQRAEILAEQLRALGIEPKAEVLCNAIAN
ncbi:MAG: hypothetical protein RMY34_16625 [Aulosira sp. DedQUE10]|nr:hypothetical protein [Aulosira sp. DedQUE10]